MSTLGFEFIKMMTGDNPTIMDLPLTSSESFVKGDMVTSSGGSVTKAAPGDSDIVGVMQETITASDSGITYGKVLLAQGAVFRCRYTGTMSGSELLLPGLALADENTVNADDTTGGPLMAIGYDGSVSTVDVVIVDTIYAVKA